jgi:excisionase family DNA binding protein
MRMNALTIGLRDAAELTGLSHWTLRRYIRDGRLAAVRIGRRVLLEPASLQRLIEQGRMDGQQ